MAVAWTDLEFHWSKQSQVIFVKLERPPLIGIMFRPVTFYELSNEYLWFLHQCLWFLAGYMVSDQINSSYYDDSLLWGDGQFEPLKQMVWPRYESETPNVCHLDQLHFAYLKRTLKTSREITMPAF